MFHIPNRTNIEVVEKIIQRASIEYLYKLTIKNGDSYFIHDSTMLKTGVSKQESKKFRFAKVVPKAIIEVCIRDGLIQNKEYKNVKIQELCRMIVNYANPKPNDTRKKDPSNKSKPSRIVYVSKSGAGERKIEFKKDIPIPKTYRCSNVFCDHYNNEYCTTVPINPISNSYYETKILVECDRYKKRNLGSPLVQFSD